MTRDRFAPPSDTDAATISALIDMLRGFYELDSKMPISYVLGFLAVAHKPGVGVLDVSRATGIESAASPEEPCTWSPQIPAPERGCLKVRGKPPKRKAKSMDYFRAGGLGGNRTPVQGFAVLSTPVSYP